MAVTTAVGVAGFPASALAKPTSPHQTSHQSSASIASTVTTVTALGSLDSAVVSWTGLATVDHYHVFVDGSHACVDVIGSAATLSCTIANLSVGVTYTATVQAMSAAPAVTDSGTSTTFTVGAPVAPTLPVATGNPDGTIDVSWTATPAGSTGAGIVNYTATTTPGGFTCTSDDSTPTSCTITSPGPLRSTPYRVSVVANGKHNTDEPTNPSAASALSPLPGVILPLEAPSNVGGVATTSGNIRANWTVPVDRTGIDHYTATVTPGGAHCSSTAALPLLDHCTITSGLTPGVAYSLQIVSNGLTTDLVSAPANSTPVVIGPLNTPTGVMAMAGDSMANVSWTAPMGFPAHTIAYYTVTGSDGDICNTADDSATSCMVTGLTNFKSATFTVVAHVDPARTDLADSPASAASAAVTPLPAAINLKAAANGKFVTAENSGAAPLIANRTVANPYEKFWVIQHADGTVSLRAAANGKYVTANPDGTTPLIANRTAVDTWEKFGLVDDGSGTFSLRALSNGKYVSAAAAGAGSLVANRSVIGSWETFTLTAAS